MFPSPPPALPLLSVAHSPARELGSSEGLATCLAKGSQPAGAGHKLVAHHRFATDPWCCRKRALAIVPPKHDPPPRPWLQPPLRVAARGRGHDADIHQSAGSAGCPVSGWRATQGADLTGMIKSIPCPARRAAQGRLSAPSRGSASAAPRTERDEFQRYLQAGGKVTVQRSLSSPKGWLARPAQPSRSYLLELWLIIFVESSHGS